MWPSFLANYMLIATNQHCIYSEQTVLIESKEQLLYCFLTAPLCLEWNLMWVSLTKHFLTFKLLSFICCMFAQLLSCVWLFENPMDCSLRVPLSMGFFRQEYWSVLPLPPPGDLPDPRIELISPASPALAGRFFTTELPRKSTCCINTFMCVVYFVCVCL